MNALLHVLHSLEKNDKKKNNKWFTIKMKSLFKCPPYRVDTCMITPEAIYGLYHFNLNRFIIHVLNTLCKIHPEISLTTRVLQLLAPFVYISVDQLTPRVHDLINC